MGTKPQITVSYKSSNTSTIYSLTSGYVQNVTWTLGRRNITDNFSSGICTISGRDISAITGANPPSLGNLIKVTVSDTSASPNYSAEFYGFISDIRRVYGTVANMDTWDIICEGSYGRVGRTSSTVTTTASASTNAMANSIATAGSYVTNYSSASSWGSTTSAQTYTGQTTDPIDILMATEQGYLLEAYINQVTVFPATTWVPQVYLVGRREPQPTNVSYNFADDGATYNSVVATKFAEIEFLSAAQNYGSKVVVQASGLADQSSGTGTYVQTINTINSTTGEAADLAGYVKTALDVSTTIPYSLTFSGSTNPTTAAPITAASYSAIKQPIRIKFRSTEYFALIEGLTFSANAEDYRVNLVLSSNVQTSWFILDSVAMGILDTNKLGF